LSSRSISRITGRFDLGGVLVVPVKINGHPTELLFDSGAAMTAISHKFAEHYRIKIDPTHRVWITGAHNEEIPTPLSTADEICVGGVIRKNLPVVVITFPPRFKLHGLIGMNFLKGLRFTVEMDTGVLILREPKKK